MIEKLVATLPQALRSVLPDRLRYPVIQCWAVTDLAGRFHPYLTGVNGRSEERAESLGFGSRLRATGQGATASSLVVGSLEYTALPMKTFTVPYIQVFESAAIAILMSIPSRELSGTPSLSGWAPEALWRCTGPLIARDSLVAAVTSLDAVSRVPIGHVPASARIGFVVRAALAIGGDEELSRWADRWLDGLDRSADSASELRGAVSVLPESHGGHELWIEALAANRRAGRSDDQAAWRADRSYELMRLAQNTWTAALDSARWLSEAEDLACERALEGMMAAGSWSASSGKSIDFAALADEEIARDPGPS